MRALGLCSFVAVIIVVGTSQSLPDLCFGAGVCSALHLVLVPTKKLILVAIIFMTILLFLSGHTGYSFLLNFTRFELDCDDDEDEDEDDEDGSSLRGLMRRTIGAVSNRRNSKTACIFSNCSNVYFRSVL